jgi:hypothetical protein
MAHVRTCLNRRAVAGIIPAICLIMGNFVIARPAYAEPSIAELADIVRQIDQFDQRLGHALRKRNKTEVLLLANTKTALNFESISNLPVSCGMAITSLNGILIASAFALNPPIRGKAIDEMTAEELRFSQVMRPSDQTLTGWYKEGLVAYRSNIISCRKLAENGPAKSALPDRLPGM